MKKITIIFLINIILMVFFSSLISSQAMNKKQNALEIDEEKEFKYLDSLLLRIDSINTSLPNDLISERNVLDVMEEWSDVLVKVWNNWDNYNNIKENKIVENIIDIRNIDNSTLPQLLLVKNLARHRFFTGNYFYLVECQGENIIIEENIDFPSLVHSELPDVSYPEATLMEIGKEYIIAVTDLKNPAESFWGPYYFYNTLIEDSPEEVSKIIKRRFFTGLNLFNGNVYPIGKYIYE